MAAPVQRNFALGVLAPSYYGRADLGLYGAGLRTLRNAYVMRLGGIQSRPGTIYKGATKNNHAVRLIPAWFDESENYVLEFGNLYVRVWRDGALRTVGTPAAWVTATAYTAGQVRENDGVNYVCILAHTSGASTEPGVGASWETNWYALTDDIFEYPTPYTTAQLDTLQWAVANRRVVTIVHPSHPPATFTRLGDASWVLADIDFTATASGLTAPMGVMIDTSSGAGIGWVVTAVDASGNESAASVFVQSDVVAGAGAFAAETALAADPVTVSWNNVAGASTYNVYRKASDDTNYGFLLNTPSNSYTDNGFLFIATYDITAPGASEIESGLFASTDNYPAVVGAYQQRLLLAATNTDPDKVYASRSASPADFSVSDPLVDSDALSWRQVGAQYNRIRFFAEVAERLWQFTSLGETFIQGSEDNILRPGEVNPRQVSQHGIAPELAPLVVGDAVLYVQARGSQVMDLWPDGTGSEISRSAWHLLDGYEVVSWCFQRVPQRICWAVRSDGKLLSVTYSREDNILGWALHETDGTVERVVSVPEGDEDAVYLVVNRTIDSATVRYVERFGNRLAAFPDADQTAMLVTVDASAPFTDTPSAPVDFTDPTAVPAPYYIAAGFGPWVDRSDIGPPPDARIDKFAVGPTRVVSNKAHYSGNLVTWALGTGFDGAFSKLDVAYGASTFVIVGEDGDENGMTAYTSTTGATWTGVTLPMTELGQTIREVAYRTGFGFLAIAGDDVAPGGEYYFYTSGTGSSWGEITTSGLAALGGPGEGLCASPSEFVISTGAADGIARSTNGSGWSAATLPTFDGVFTVGGYNVTVWCGDRFATVFEDETGFGLLTSTTGASWTMLRFTQANMADFTPAALAWNDSDDILYIYGRNGDLDDLAFTTPDFTVFTPVVAPMDGDTAAWVPYASTFVSGLRQGDANIATAGYSPAGAIVGLGWLEGESPSVVSTDGTVLASPATSDETVVDGRLLLPEGADSATDGIVGLPFVVDIQTLDIETVNGTRKDAGILVNRIGLWVEDTAGLSARATEPSSATSLDGFQPLPQVDEDGNATTDLVTGYREVTIDGVWTRGGRIFLRNVDPTPLTIHAISPMGNFGRS